MIGFFCICAKKDLVNSCIDLSTIFKEDGIGFEQGFYLFKDPKRYDPRKSVGVYVPPTPSWDTNPVVLEK